MESVREGEDIEKSNSNNAQSNAKFVSPAT